MNAVRSIVAGMLCLVAGMTQAVPLYQCPLTVGGYAEGKAALADFPVLVRISTAIDRFNYGDCDAGGADISFTSEDGETVYPHEVDTWNPDGESLVWVKLPSMAHGTKFLFRWSDPNPPVNNKADVWSGYAGVWHLGEQEPDSYADSSGNGLTATNAVSATITEKCKAKAGKVGDGRWQPKLTLRIPSYDGVGGTFTASGWFYLDERTGYESFFNHKQSWDKGDGWQCNLQNSDTQIFVSGSENKASTDCYFGASVKGRWVHLAAVYTGTTVTLYENGKKIVAKTGKDVAINAAKDNDRELVVGGSVRGAVDEIRICKAALSADWLKAENDMVNGAGFVTSGTTEILSTTVIVVSSDGPRYGVASPAYGQIAEPEAGTTYDFSCTTATQTLNTAGTTRAVCTGWELRRLSDGELIKTSSSEGEQTFSCSHTYVQGEGVELKWLWQVQHLVTATAGDGGTVSPTSTWAVAGMSLPISAEASNGYSFYRWNGDANSTDAEIEMTVDGPKSVKALFAIETHVSTKEEFSTALTEALSSIKAGEICAETIWLADGNYQLAAKTTIDVPIRIRGGSDDPTKVVFSPDKKDAHEMFVLAHADAALSGLTVQGGYGTGGQSYSTYGGAQGADVTITSAGGTVENCILRNAKGEKWGACAGGLKQGGGLVSRCVISNCSSSCAWGNYCSYGNAALVYGGVMENTLITKNSGGGSDAGGGAICLAGTGKMINCTVAGNSMNGYAGIFIDGTSAKAINCLVCNNTSAHRTENYAGVYNGSSVASYFTACVAPVQINDSCFTASGLGLKDAGHGDYHPILGSVCLDNGTLDGITPSALDLDGNARIDEDSGKIDVGCYELVLEGIAASVTCTPADTQGLVPVTRTFSSIVQGGTPTAYEWSINGEVQPDETGASFSRTFTKAGSYTVSLRVSDAKGTYDAVNDILITALPTNVYVDAKSATPVAPYDTPETAAKTFADAYAAAGDYSVILIAPNNYSRTSQITIDKKVTVRGTGKSPLDTILSLALKNNTYGRVMQFNCKEALVCNLTLEGGWVNTQNGKGGGVYIADKGGTVSNCVIRSCKCGAGDECGGGAFLGCADACITHCVFTNCSVVGESCGQNSGARGGFAASITAGTLRDSLIVGCYQNGFNKNYPGDDGAVAMHGGKLVNCTIVGCRAEECAGIRAEGGQVINCIVSGNTTTSSNPTNAVWRGSGTTVRNSLADQDVGGKFLMEETALTFVGTGTHRYRLRGGSKAIDAGDASAVTSTVDLHGNPRILCGAVDLGCYEKKIGLTVLVK